MKEAFFNYSKETIYLVMDLVDGVTLKRYVKDNYSSDGKIRGLKEEVCKELFIQLL